MNAKKISNRTPTPQAIEKNKEAIEVERSMKEFIILQDLDGIAICLDHGCNINQLKSAYNRSCADLAISGGYHQSFRFLIEKGG